MVVIDLKDSRYASYITGMNQRWVSAPNSIVLPSSTAEVVECVQSALDANQRISVRSGGNCYQDFVCNGDVRVIVDMSDMDAIYYDPRMRAIAIEAGATLSRTYETLYRRWNVTLPGGPAGSVGIGGHVCGGGFGLLSRRHGLTVDHLFGVEVVVVDQAGKVRSVTATRSPSDPNHDLWWAHAGGGGGSFGIVTRFWFRTPGATGDDPGKLLPQPPAEVLLNVRTLPWEHLTRDRFVNLVRNYGAWYETHSAVDCPELALAGYLVLYQKAAGLVALLTQVDATVDGAEQMLCDYLADITHDMDATQASHVLPHLAAPRKLPWLKAVRLLGTNSPSLADPTLRGTYKSACMRRNFPVAHAETLYEHLTRDGYANRNNTMVMALPYGGAVRAVPSSATPVAQRDSIMKVLFQSLWSDANEDAMHIEWIRRIYAATYAATGGVPVPDETTDGCFVNYPDTDLNSTVHNKSGVAWSTLYYKDNYARLQRAKAQWDPFNVFRHSQSIEGSAA